MGYPRLRSRRHAMGVPLKTEIIRVRLDPELLAEFKAVTKDNMSAVMRRLIERYIRERRALIRASAK